MRSVRFSQSTVRIFLLRLRHCPWHSVELKHKRSLLTSEVLESSTNGANEHLDSQRNSTQVLPCIWFHRPLMSPVTSWLNLPSHRINGEALLSRLSHKSETICADALHCIPELFDLTVRLLVVEELASLTYCYRVFKGPWGLANQTVCHHEGRNDRSIHDD